MGWSRVPSLSRARCCAPTSVLSPAYDETPLSGSERTPFGGVSFVWASGVWSRVPSLSRARCCAPTSVLSPAYDETPLSGSERTPFGGVSFVWASGVSGSACGAGGADGPHPRPSGPPCSPDRHGSCPRTSTSGPDSRHRPPTPGYAWRCGPGTNGRG